MLEAAPVVAEPPVVFPATVASPVEALWQLVFVTLKLLSLFTVSLFKTLELIVLLESGPVLEMFPNEGELVLEPCELELLLSTEADALKLLEFEAPPEVALPPVVLW